MRKLVKYKDNVLNPKILYLYVPSYKKNLKFKNRKTASHLTDHMMDHQRSDDPPSFPSLDSSEWQFLDNI